MGRPLRRPIWLPSRLSRLKRLQTEIIKKITLARFAVAVLVLPLILYVYREATRDTLIIDPFTVPKRFEEAGLTSDVMANRIGDKLNQIEEATQFRLKKDNLTSFKDEASLPEVEIPGTHFDLKTVVDITRSVFGVYPKHVSGDIVILALANEAVDTKPLARVKPQATVTIYVAQGRNRGAAASITGEAEDVVTLVQRTAETLLGLVNPYVLAAYRYDHGEYSRAIEILQSNFDKGSDSRDQKIVALLLGPRAPGGARVRRCGRQIPQGDRS